MKILVKNAPNTSGLVPPQPYTSWVEYWERNGGVFTTGIYECPNCGLLFRKSQLVGAHVQKIGDSKMYITPLCEGCNHKNNSYSVDDRNLVPAP